MAAGSPPRARTFLLSKQALALSMAGDRPAALTVVADLRRCHDRAGDPDAEPDRMGIYEWAHIRHEEARVYYQLGMGEEAVTAVDDSLPARRDARPRAFSPGAQALGNLFARDPDVEHACALAHQLIAHAGRLESACMTIRLDEVMRGARPLPGRAERRGRVRGGPACLTAPLSEGKGARRVGDLAGEMRDILAETSTRLGLNVREARLIRLHSNALFALPKAALLVRIATDPDAADNVAASLHATRWLRSRVYPCTEPAAEQLLIVRGPAVAAVGRRNRQPTSHRSRARPAARHLERDDRGAPS